MANSPKPSNERERGPTHLWFSNLKTEDQKTEFKNMLATSNTPIMRRLLEIVEQERLRTLEACLASSNYQSPSWALTQADNVGYQRALKLVEHLLKDIVK